MFEEKLADAIRLSASVVKPGNDLCQLEVVQFVDADLKMYALFTT